MAILVGLLAATPTGGWAAEICATIEDKPVASAERIGIRFDASSISAARVESAIALWRACRNFGSGFPELVAGEESGRRLEVDHRPDEAGPGRCGSFAGNRIILWGRQRQPDGTLRPCGAVEQNLAHELGHVLGLADAPLGASCSRRIMARLHDANLGSRRVQEDECMAVGQLWLTPSEVGRLATAGRSPRRVTAR